MCGIVGISSYRKAAISNTERDIFLSLLLADQARGADGTGVFSVSDTNDVQYCKIGGTPTDLLRDPVFYEQFWDKMIATDFIRWVVGHNRFATTGKRSTKNAHPFRHDHITLVMNGTLRGGKLPELAKFDVDSEAVCAGIAKYGLEETLDQIHGPYAIVYYDRKKQKLNMFRNKGRPLFAALGDKDQVVAFASEKLMLEWAMTRHKMEVQHIEEVQPETLYEFGIDKNKSEPKLIKLQNCREFARFISVPKPTAAETSGGGLYEVDADTGECRKIDPINSVKGNTDPKETESAYKARGKKKNYGAQIPGPVDLTATPPSQQGSLLTAVNRALESKKTQGNVTYYPCADYNGRMRGHHLHFSLIDYDKIEADSVRAGEDIYIVTGESAENGLGSVEIRMRVLGTESLQMLLGADRIKAKIVSILIADKVADKNVMYVTDPEPIYNNVRIPSEEDIFGKDVAV